MNKEQKRIREAYSACLRLQQRYQVGFGNLLEQSVDASEDQERRHRRAGGGRWRMPVADTARWFAVRAATEVDALREEYADVLGYDYSSWVTR